MRKSGKLGVPHAGLGLFCLAAAVAMLPKQSLGQGWQLGTNTTLRAELTLKETFDSNVYLQDVEPSPAVTNAAKPFQESFVTSVTPRLAFDWKPLTEFNLTLSYAPELVWYHSEPSEDHVAHRSALSFSGKVKDVVWEQFNTLTYIDGSEEGLTFGGPGGAPAIGGIPIRERREALIYRNGFRAFHPRGDWFFRPAAASYIHDFMTKVRPPSQYPYYQNYVDRNDFNAGLDVGYKALKDVYFVLGYRYGFQEEPPLPGQPWYYSNNYNRLLAGFEGRITDWLKMAVALGPDFRNFYGETRPGFDRHHTVLFVDAAVTLMPSKQDTIIFTMKQFEQPAFGVPSSYEDITYDLVWRHRLDQRFSAGLGFRAYGGDWLPPIQRDDWIFTPSVSVNCVLNKHWSGELSYSYDWVDSRVPNTEGREFTRHLVSLGVRCAF